jgi:hypothetical protein
MMESARTTVPDTTEVVDFERPVFGPQEVPMLV